MEVTVALIFPQELKYTLEHFAPTFFYAAIIYVFVPCLILLGSCLMLSCVLHMPDLEELSAFFIRTMMAGLSGSFMARKEGHP